MCARSVLRGFLKAVDLRFYSFKTVGKRLDLFKFIPYFALLKPNNSNYRTAQNVLFLQLPDSLVFEVSE